MAQDPKIDAYIAKAGPFAQAPTAKTTLEAFAPPHRREYIEWISEAKRPETHGKRIAQESRC